MKKCRRVRYLPSGKIIEIGCGGGRDAKELLAIGYEYVGIDPSAGLLAVARRKNPQAIFFQQSVYELDFPDNAFDGFWAAAVLLHIRKNRIEEVLVEIRRIVRPDGAGVIILKEGEGERVVEEEKEEGRYRRFFAHWGRDEFSRILERNGYEVLETQTNPMSKKTTGLCIL